MKDRTAYPRRAFLRGLGTVAVGLPLLDAFAPRRARAADAPAPRCAVFIRQSNGVAQAGMGEPERFWPSQLGPISAESLRAEPDRALIELADHANKLLLVSGTRYPFKGTPCAHSTGSAQILTAADVTSEDPAGLAALALGESIDNRVAAAINPAGRDPLTLITSAILPGNVAMVLSYRGPRQPRAAENNPWSVYKRMTGLAGMDEAVIAQIAARRKSVNDLIRAQLKALLGRKDLSREDRRRLDLHFSAIRDVELKLACTLPEMRQRDLEGIDPVDGDNYVPVTRMHMDLIALAFACDHTRVATLQMGQCGDITAFSVPGFRDGERLPGYHAVSHRAIRNDGSPGDAIEHAQDMHHEIDKLHARLFKYLLDKLASYALLERGIAVWMNELGHGVSHSLTNVPWVIAGHGGAGYLKQGQFIDAGDVPHNRLLNTLLNALGVRKPDGSLIDDFGDATLDKGEISSLIA